MKRTNMLVACGKKNGYTVYRVAMKDSVQDDKFFVKWNGNLVDVTDDIKARNYTIKIRNGEKRL